MQTPQCLSFPTCRGISDMALSFSTRQAPSTFPAELKPPTFCQEQAGKQQWQDANGYSERESSRGKGRPSCAWAHPHLGKLRHAAPNCSSCFLQTSVPSATKRWGPGSRWWRRCGSSTTPTASPAARATGSWPGSATSRETGAPCVTPASRYPSSFRENRHPRNIPWGMGWCLMACVP